MINKYSKCQKCPAFSDNLLTEVRKQQIEKWEYKRDQYIKRMKKVNLILLGESMPEVRYFYDINTEYNDRGLRYTLKKEFEKLELSDSLFLQSMSRKGIVLYDCALCPIYKLEDNVAKRKAATHCLLTINIENLNKYPDVPIATIFPQHRGFLKREIPEEIKYRIKGEYGFEDQTGLRGLYEEIKK
jgi:hypothetical protein